MDYVNVKHWIDALCVGNVEEIHGTAKRPLFIKCMGQGQKLTRVDASGFPRSYMLRKSRFTAFPRVTLSEPASWKEKSRDMTKAASPSERAAHSIFRPPPAWFREYRGNIAKLSAEPMATLINTEKTTETALPPRPEDRGFRAEYLMNARKKSAVILLDEGTRRMWF